MVPYSGLISWVSFFFHPQSKLLTVLTTQEQMGLRWLQGSGWCSKKAPWSRTPFELISTKPGGVGCSFFFNFIFTRNECLIIIWLCAFKIKQESRVVRTKVTGCCLFFSFQRGAQAGEKLQVVFRELKHINTVRSMSAHSQLHTTAVQKAGKKTHNCEGEYILNETLGMKTVLIFDIAT